MADTTWHRVERELGARQQRHQQPSSWAELARVLCMTEQRINNWKRRGVPAAQHAAIASAFGWSVDQLLGLDEAPAKVAPPPPAPPSDFADRHEVSDSDWGLLQDLHDAMASPSKAEQIKKLLVEVRQERAHYEEQFRNRIKGIQDAGGGRVGGISVFDEFDDTPAHEPQKRGQR